MLPALDLGQVRVGASVYHHLIHDLIRLLRHNLPPPPDLAQQPHAQRDVYALQAAHGASYAIPSTGYLLGVWQTRWELGLHGEVGTGG